MKPKEINMKKSVPALFLAFVLLSWSGAVAAATVITNRGSDTFLHLAQAWATQYHEAHPEISVDIRGCGTGTGISALINNHVDLANASRPIKIKERIAAEANGVRPMEHLVAHDALAILVHPTNPLSWLSMAALAEVYDSKGTIDDWGKFGVRVPNCPGNRIHLVGRQINSGTHDYFQEVVLGERRDFKHNMESRDVSSSEEVVDQIGRNPCAIGYIGMAFESNRVKKLKISRESGTELVEPTIENVMNRRYPISRPLFMYTNGMPQGEVKNYLGWILSDTGQCQVQKSGFAPARPVTCPAQ